MYHFEKKFRLVALALLLFILSVFPFQSCRSPKEVEIESSRQILQAGNGQGYDGKLNIFYREHSGYTCDKNPSEVSRIEFLANQVYLTSYTPGYCDGHRVEVPEALIERSKTYTNLIALKEGIYRKRTEGYVDSYVDIWCQSPQIEFYVENYKKTKKSTFFWSDLSNGKQGQFDIEKVYNGSGILLKQLSPETSFLATIATPHLGHPYVGVYPGGINFFGAAGIDNVALNCRVGGPENPIESKKNYALLLDFVVGKFAEFKHGHSEKFKNFRISPELPKGLSIDKNTGTVRGMATSSFMASKFTIFADGSEGAFSEEVEIVIAQPIYVTAESDDLVECGLNDRTCSLESALQLANSIQPNPALVLMDEGTYFLAGHHLEVDGNISLVGKGEGNTLIDARNLSRHFWVHANSQLRLRSLSLTRGSAAELEAEGHSSVEIAESNYGGSIYCQKCSVDADGVTFSKNVTPGTFSKGGAVYVKSGTFRAKNTSFLENQTEARGGSQSGGAIAVEGGLLQLEKVKFYRNKSLRGGAVDAYITSDGSTISNSLFIENHGVTGGGIHIQHGDLIIEKSYFDGNKALIRGGGAFVDTANIVLIKNSTFTRNLSHTGVAIEFSNRFVDIAQFHRFYFILNSSFVKNSVISNINNYSYTLGLGGPIFFQNNLISGNSTIRNCRENYFGNSVSVGGNIDDRNDCLLHDPSDRVNTKVRFNTESPVRVGYFTYGYVPSPDSSAYGGARLGSCPEVDQAGRSRWSEYRCDSGAFQAR